MKENKKINGFEDLIVWQQAVELYVEITLLLKSNPTLINNTFGYQITKATLSISNNIAEGFERNGNKEFMQFLYIAKGSCGEVRSMLHVLQRINPSLDLSKEMANCKNISVKIYNLTSYIANSELKGIKYKDLVKEPNLEYGFNNIERNPLNSFEPIYLNNFEQ